MKKSVIRNFVIFFSFFLVMILSLLSLLNVRGKRALQETLEETSQNQMLYMKNRLSETIWEAEIYATQYSANEKIRSYPLLKQDASYLEQLLMTEEIRSLFRNQLIASQAIEDFGIYWSSTQEKIASSENLETIWPLIKEKGRGWHFIDQSLYFFLDYPYYVEGKNKQAEYTVVVKLKDRYMREILEKISPKASTSSFYLTEEKKVISYQTIQKTLLKKVEQEAKKGESATIFYNKNELINMMRIPKINTYLISSTDTGEWARHLNNFNWIFLIGLFSVLIYGIFLIYKFNEDIVRQIETLSSSLGKAIRGDYKTRIEMLPENEFGLLFENFNEMTSNTQMLISSLKKENELRKSAEIKQMQAQINPHFLYNNFSYIVSMAHNNPDAVEEMALYLAEYYQAVTDSTHQTVTVESEMKMIDAYLHIMCLRKDIIFSIHVDEELQKKEIVPLIFQPLVENAIEHGIEARQGANQICIKGRKQGEGWNVAILDDGFGLSEERIAQLYKQIHAPVPPELHSGVGLWNVNQRLINMFGVESALKFSVNKWGGTTVQFTLHYPELKEAADTAKEEF